MNDPRLWLHRDTIRPDWVDYNGHMNEAYYVLIFGDATDAFYDHVGLDGRFRAEHNVSVYTVESHIRYLAEGHEGDQLAVETRLLDFDAKRLRLHHSMQRASDGRCLAVIEIMALHVDKRGTAATAFHREPLARIEAVAREQASLPLVPPVVSRHWAAPFA
jgi:acyl-CoA thioesterase FadM